MKYNAVIFDLDGTILSTLDDLADSVNYVLEKNGMPKRTKEEIRRFVGNGIRSLIERSVAPETNTLTTDKVFADFIPYYKEHCADKTKPYDGIMDMLYTLKDNGIKLAVLSNKADYAVQELCDRYFNGIMEAVSGEIEGVPKKPAPDGVNLILDRLGVSKEKCVYIGDSEVDVYTANNSELDCICVDWGFRDRSVLQNAGAKTIVSTPEELADTILSNAF